MKSLLTLTIYVLFIGFFSGCVHAKSSKIASNPVIVSDQMLFLVFSIERDSSTAKNVVSLVNKNKVEGTFKRSKSDEHGFDQYIKFKILDSFSGNDSILLEHPLKKRIEYLNENNQLAVKQLDLKKEEFMVRLPLKSSYSQIEIWEKLNDQPEQLLTTFK